MTCKKTNRLTTVMQQPLYNECNKRCQILSVSKEFSGGVISQAVKAEPNFHGDYSENCSSV